MTTNFDGPTRRRHSFGCVLAGASAAFLMQVCAAHAHDPAQSDGDKYKVRFENQRVRVLEYRDNPGDKTNQHDHPAFVLFAVGPFKRRIVLPDGKVILREFKAGEVMWSDAQTHIGENVGDTPTHVVMIELK
jgi:beta-alanine degradation protein BauB